MDKSSKQSTCNVPKIASTLTNLQIGLRCRLQQQHEGIVCRTLLLYFHSSHIGRRCCPLNGKVVPIYVREWSTAGLIGRSSLLPISRTCNSAWHDGGNSAIKSRCVQASRLQRLRLRQTSSRSLLPFSFIALLPYVTYNVESDRPAHSQRFGRRGGDFSV